MNNARGTNNPGAHIRGRMHVLGLPTIMHALYGWLGELLMNDFGPLAHTQFAYVFKVLEKRHSTCESFYRAQV